MPGNDTARRADGSVASIETFGALDVRVRDAPDVDDIDSFGPEIVTISRLARGRTYRYYVNNFSQTFTPGLTGSPVKVELTVRGQLRTFTPPAGEGGNLWWSVFDLVVGPDCSITVNPIQAWSASEPVTPNTGAVTALDYCQ